MSKKRKVKLRQEDIVVLQMKFVTRPRDKVRCIRMKTVLSCEKKEKKASRAPYTIKIPHHNQRTVQCSVSARLHGEVNNDTDTDDGVEAEHDNNDLSQTSDLVTTELVDLPLGGQRDPTVEFAPESHDAGDDTEISGDQGDCKDPFHTGVVVGGFVALPALTPQLPVEHAFVRGTEAVVLGDVRPVRVVAVGASWSPSLDPGSAVLVKFLDPGQAVGHRSEVLRKAGVDNYRITCKRGAREGWRKHGRGLENGR